MIPLPASMLRQWVAILRNVAPLDYPVTVRRVRWAIDPVTGIPRQVGSCGVDDDRVTIQIDARLDRFSALDALMHEWAHARREEYAHPEDSESLSRHDDAFWIELGSIYRAFHDASNESRGTVL
jgi:hypothetical protein